MCGLLAAFNLRKKEVNDFIINQFEDQQKRGKEGFGIIRINENKSIEIDRACETTKFLLDLYLKKSSMIIAHHRTPTSTDNQLDQTHPIFVSNELLNFNYLVVHNGVISNDDELRKKHLELGFEYTTEYNETYRFQSEPTIKFNDSEALAIELALFIEKKISAIGTDNTAAFIILQVDKKTNKGTKVFFGKNAEYGALKIELDKTTLNLSSEGIGENVEPNKLFAFDLNNKKSFKITHRKIEFIKKEIPKIPEPVKTIVPGVSPALPAPTLTTTNSFEKKGEVISPVRRDWASGVEDDPYEVPGYGEKGYKEQMENDLKLEIKDASSDEIMTIIDSQLESESDKLSEILAGFKAYLLQQKYDSRANPTFNAKIFRILDTMKSLTDIAEAEYSLKSDAEDIEDYNDGYKTQTEEKRDVSRYLDDEYADVNWPVTHPENRRFGFHGDY